MEFVLLQPLGNDVAADDSADIFPRSQQGETPWEHFRSNSFDDDNYHQDSSLHTASASPARSRNNSQAAPPAPQDTTVDSQGRSKNLLQWLKHHNFSVLILGILMLFVVERLLKNLGDDIAKPAMTKVKAVVSEKIQAKFGRGSTSSTSTGTRVVSTMASSDAATSGSDFPLHARATMENVMWHILEFTLAIVLIYLLSKYVFKHKKRAQAPPAPAPTVDTNASGRGWSGRYEDAQQGGAGGTGHFVDDATTPRLGAEYFFTLQR